MAPTRMKLRLRRRDVATGGEESARTEEQSRESGTRTSSRRKKTNSNAVTSSTSPPSTSTSSSSTRAAMVVAAEDTSPDSKCPICLDRFNNLAYLDRCLHRFCFPCIQEWSHNKAECPLCKQPFASILHSVRAQDDFKEYTLKPAPATSGGSSSTAAAAATAAVVAAVAAAAARSEHQMRLMLRRRRRTAADTGGDNATRSYLHGETPVRRWRRERSGRAGGGGGASGSSSSEYGTAWEWHFDAPPPASFSPLHFAPHPPPALSSGVTQERGGEDEQARQRTGTVADAEGHSTGLCSPPKNPVSYERVSQRLTRCLLARQRSQQAGTLQTLSDRETLRLRRALYYCGIRVHGVAGISGPQDAPREITADSFHRHRSNMNRLVPWLRRELTVLYGTQRRLVDLVLGIIVVQVSRHGLENLAALEAELRPFLLIRTNHFVHELLSFARSPLTMELYDMLAAYEPPAVASSSVAASETDRLSSASGGSSVIAISEDEEECGEGRSAVDDVIQTGSCLNLSVWDDETPGPSYSTAETLSSLATLQQKPTNQETGQQEEEEEEEECLIVGYKKPIAERTPELVQLSSDTEEENEDNKTKEEESTEKVPPVPPITTTTTDPPPPSSSFLPTIPPSTSGTYREGQATEDADSSRPRSCSWSASSGRSGDSVCVLRPSKDKRRRRHRRGRSRSRQERSGTLNNPNRSIYPAMMSHRRRRSPSSAHSSVESGSPLSPSSPLDPSWSFTCSPLSSTSSSRSSSSPSPSPSTQRSSPQTPPTPQLQHSPCDARHREKPGGKRKYKSRHLDNNDKDPTWRPSGEERREKKRESDEKRRRRRRVREDRERKRRRRESDRHRGQSNSRKCREERSPSVEIIFERTAPSCDVQLPPAHKHRRKRQHTTLQSSSPIVITLDSDSSCDPVNVKNFSSSSSPLSSQQTVDFSDLPPLPLVHSSGMGGTLGEEIGDLPVDILDRSSDVSEVDVRDRSKATGPIAVESVDNSDREVDVENDDDEGPSVSPFKPIRTHNPKPASTSDTHLLATILDDLKDIVQPHCSFDSRRSPDSRKERFQQPCEKHEGRSSQAREPLPQDLEFNDLKDENPLPPQQDPGNTQTSPVGLRNSQHSTNASPLKNKEAGSPQSSLSERLPLCPSNVAPKNSVYQDPNLRSSQVDSSDVIPPISTLKKHFSGSLELRGDPVSSDSQPGEPDIKRSTIDLCKPPVDSHLSSTPEKGVAGSDCKQHQDLTDSCPSLTLQPSSKVTSSHCGTALLALHHSISTHPGTDASTVGSYVRPAVSVKGRAEAGAADETAPAACSSVFSAVASKNTSPPVSVSSSDAQTLNSFSTVGSHASQRSHGSFDPSSSSKNDLPSKRIPESTGNFNWTLDGHHHPSAPSDDSKTSSVANHDGCVRPVDLNSTSSLTPDGPGDSLDSALIDRRLNHTALPSSAVHVNNTKRSTSSDQTVDSKHPNHFGSCYDPLLTLKNCQLSLDSKTSRGDFHTDDCLASSPATSEPVSGDIRLDSRSPVEEPSPTSIWTNSAS